MLYIVNNFGQSTEYNRSCLLWWFSLRFIWKIRWQALQYLVVMAWKSIQSIRVGN